MLRAAQLCDSLNLDGVCARALDLRAHLIQKVREIDDFRLLRSVLDIGCPFRENRCHHDVFCRADARKVQINRIPDQPLRAGYRLHIGVCAGDDRAERLETLEMQIDRSGADRASTRMRDSRSAFASEQRPHDQNGRAHLVDQFKLCLRRKNVLCANRKDIFFQFFDFRAQRGQQLFHKADIPQFWNIANDTGIFC